MGDSVNNKTVESMFNLANKINNNIKDLSIKLKKYNLKLFLSNQNPAKELKQIVKQALIEKNFNPSYMSGLQVTFKNENEEFNYCDEIISVTLFFYLFHEKDNNEVMAFLYECFNEGGDHVSLNKSSAQYVKALVDGALKEYDVISHKESYELLRFDGFGSRISKLVKFEMLDSDSLFLNRKDSLVFDFKEYVAPVTIVNIY